MGSEFSIKKRMSRLCFIIKILIIVIIYSFTTTYCGKNNVFQCSIKNFQINKRFI